jgi:hypothetical protein
MTKVKISLDDLTDAKAYALAEMCKRMIWDNFRRLSAGTAERDAMNAPSSRQSAGGRPIVFGRVGAGNLCTSTRARAREIIQAMFCYPGLKAELPARCVKHCVKRGAQLSD